MLRLKCAFTRSKVIVIACMSVAALAQQPAPKIARRTVPPSKRRTSHLVGNKRASRRLRWSSAAKSNKAREAKLSRSAPIPRSHRSNSRN